MKIDKICKTAIVLLSFLTFNNVVYSQFASTNDELVTEKRVGIGYGSAGIGNSNGMLNINRQSGAFHNIHLTSDNFAPDLYFELNTNSSQLKLHDTGLKLKVNNSEAMFIYNEGIVRIGMVPMPNDPYTNYKLIVKDGILTEKIKVAIKGSPNWSDYVFDKDYKLNSLDKVEKYVKKNKHLPNVPSADEVVENGINLGEMDATLLRQIEELWLHTIELNKEKENLENTIEKLVKRVKKLEKK